MIPPRDVSSTATKYRWVINERGNAHGVSQWGVGSLRTSRTASCSSACVSLQISTGKWTDTLSMRVAAFAMLLHVFININFFLLICHNSNLDCKERVVASTPQSQGQDFSHGHHTRRNPPEQANASICTPTEDVSRPWCTAAARSTEATEACDWSTFCSWNWRLPSPYIRPAYCTSMISVLLEATLRNGGSH